MNHQTELDFVQELLKTYRLSIHIFKSESKENFWFLGKSKNMTNQ